MVLITEKEKELLQDTYSLLLDLLEYMDDRSDVLDGDYGNPEPNQEMMFLTEITRVSEKLNKTINKLKSHEQHY